MVLAPAFARLILARRQFFPLFFNALRWSASRRLSLKVRAFCNSCSILCEAEQCMASTEFTRNEDHWSPCRASCAHASVHGREIVLIYQTIT
jgi:hypothetical protein